MILWIQWLKKTEMYITVVPVIEQILVSGKIVPSGMFNN